MNKIVILTYGDFPNGDAVSVRMHSFSKLLQQLGYKVYIISMGRTKPYIWNEYDGIHYISIRSEKKNIISRIGNVLLYKKRAKSVLEKIENIQAIMPLALTINTLRYCKKFAIKNKLILLTDCTEWYSPCEFRLGKFSRTYLLNDITNRIIIDKQWNVISISRYFEEYFQKKGIKTVRIPAIMDVSNIDINHNTPNHVKKVVYAGSPAKKDSLDIIIKGFELLDVDLSSKIELHIYGVDKTYYSQFGDISKVPSNIHFHGRVPRGEVMKALRDADFTTLFRDDSKRFTKAGFPSKVAESMSIGVPMITNYTSDLELYLKDSENAIIVKEYSVQSYIEALRRAANCSDESIIRMHKIARMTAEKFFNYNNYYSVLKEMLED